MNKPKKHAYTLLADDNLAISSLPEYEKHLKAHIIISVLTNSTLLFSDNQVISSLNLRSLLRNDREIRQIAKDKILSFALRSDDAIEHDDIGQRLIHTHAAFEREGKIKLSKEFYEDKNELIFLGKYGDIVDWTYWDIRNNFTNLCKKLLISDSARDKLGEVFYSTLEEEILIEEERDKGLGRIFLQERLLESLKNKHPEITIDQLSFIKNCSEAPYLSNLPSMLNRNPIYEPQHKVSFELMRGIPYQFKEIDAPKKIPTKLDSAHFVEGLSRLTIDDIYEIRSHDIYKKFIRLSCSGISHFSEFQELRERFVDLNILIDDKIYSKFSDLKSSNKETPRIIRSRVAATKTAIVKLVDVLGLFVSAPGIGTSSSFLIDFVTKKIGVDEDTLGIQEVRSRKLLQEDLTEHLIKRGLGDENICSEEIVDTQSHSSEIIVGS